MRKQQKLFVLTMTVILVVSLFASCASGGNGSPTNEGNGGLAQFSEPVKGQQMATIKVKDFGEIQFMLFPKAAPKGVENFVTHAKNGYYDGVVFHRIVKDFMIQGGDPDGTGMGGESIWGEGFGVEYDGSLRNFTGALAYANRNSPNTNQSQFFIVNAPPISEDDMTYYVKASKEEGGNSAVTFPREVQNKYKEIGGYPSLDGGYTVFGQLYKGQDVVDQIMNTETVMDDWGQEQSVPVTPVVIETVTIWEFGS